LPLRATTEGWIARGEDGPRPANVEEVDHPGGGLGQMIVLVPLLLAYCRRRRRINAAVIVGVRHRF